MKYPRYKIVIAAIDSMAIALLLLSSIFWVYRNHHQHQDVLMPFSAADIAFSLIYTIVAIFIFQSNNLYKINVIYRKSQHLIFFLKSILYLSLLIITVSFLLRMPPVFKYRLSIVLFLSLGLVSGGLLRVGLLPFVMKFFYRQKNFRKRLLIIGSSYEAKKIAIESEYEDIYGFELVGFVSKEGKRGDKVYREYKKVGELSDIPALVENSNIDEIIFASSQTDYEDFFTVLDICKSTQARIVVASEVLDIINAKLFTEKYYNIPVVRLGRYDNLPSVIMIKRVIDLVGAFTGLLLFSPLLMAIALLIKMTSKGPVLFKQTRIGKDGTEFNFYKFRTMTVSNDRDTERAKIFKDYIHNSQKAQNSTKIVDEKRITRIGRFLRKTSLDELPQLFNVVKGDMSLVGPRPCLPYEWQAYDEWHKRRTSILPGCTGLWQVTSRAQGSFDDMVLLDMYYINNISPWFDIQLILKTIPVMIFGRGGK